MKSILTPVFVSFSHSTFLAATLIIIGVSTSGRCQGQGSVAVSLALQSPTVTLHEPIVANLAIHNDLAERVTVNLGYDREGSFEFTIVQPDGSTYAAPRIAQREGITRLPELLLSPGETYWQRLVLDEWYPFKVPGNYRILMKLTTTITTDSGAPAKVGFSQELSLQVGARDEKRLEKVCERLATAAMVANADTALDAARSLSYVNDVAAVPYLARLTKQGLYKVVTRNVALRGLGRIARSEGLEAVISSLSAEDRKLEPEIKAEALQ